jgi:hypothetical protein
VDATPALVRLNDVVVASATAALRLQHADGSFPGGENGPYRDAETPARNTAHWLVTLLRAYEITGRSALRAAALRAAAYLTAPSARPAGATFLCRTNSRKDRCNGLIGQAWVIEALAVAADSLADPRYRTLAKEVFRLHPFDDAAGLWRVVHVEGAPGRVDLNFNHQLWFAAAGALVEGGSDPAIGRAVRRFLDRAHEIHFRVTRGGRIRHRITEILPEADLQVPQYTARPETRADLIRRETGYHAFNLYAFALLRLRVPSHPLWRSRRFGAALRFLGAGAYLRGLDGNEYGYSYNPVGFEVAFALQVFRAAGPGRSRPASWWVGQQLARTYDPARRLLDRATPDGVTLSARLYEATRLHDVALRLPRASAERSPDLAVAGTALA